jgi:hypothetical protein
MTGRQEYDRTKDRQRILGKYMIDWQWSHPHGCILYIVTYWNTEPSKGVGQGFTKGCRLHWLTNSALVYEPKCGGWGGGGAGSRPMDTAVHMEPK